MTGEVAVEIWPDAGKNYKFRLLKDQPKRPAFYIQGTLNQISANTCFVSGQIDTLHGFLQVLALLVVILGLAIVSASLEALILVLFLLICFSGVWFASSWSYSREIVLRPESWTQNRSV
jgi:hypothetical protein